MQAVLRQFKNWPLLHKILFLTGDEILADSLDNGAQ